MRELDIISLTRVPEFEQKCNIFVEKVIRTITPKYSDLYINAENATLEPIYRLNETIQQWKRIIPAEDRERFIRASKRVAERSDKYSAFFNNAIIDIQDQTDKHRKKLVKKAVEDVRKIARKYQPDETFEDTNYNDRYYPSAHLSYFFHNKLAL